MKKEIDILRQINSFQQFICELNFRQSGTTTKLAQLLVLNYAQDTDTYVIVKNHKRKDVVRHILKDLGHPQLEKFVITMNDIRKVSGSKASFIFDSDTIFELTEEAKQTISCVVARSKEISNEFMKSLDRIKYLQSDTIRQYENIESHKNKQPNLYHRVFDTKKYKNWKHTLDCLNGNISRNKTYTNEEYYKINKIIREIDYEYQYTIS